MDYDNHCQIPFGGYVQALNYPKKTNPQYSRRIKAIYLTVNLNKQEGRMVMDFKSGLPVTQRKVTDIPVNDLVTKAAKKMAADDKMTKLKFENKSGVLLHPNGWLIGVDYEDKN